MWVEFVEIEWRKLRLNPRRLVLYSAPSIARGEPLLSAPKPYNRFAGNVSMFF